MHMRWVIPACVVLAGCADGSTPDTSVVVRDSLGIRIVESMAPLWADSSGWRVDPRPLLDLAESGSGPGHEFQTVRDILRLPDGRIIVVDEGNDEVSSYGPDGTLLRRMGRGGEGPGEFRRPRTVERVAGDSLAIWDPSLRRLTMLDSQLSVGRVNVLPDPNIRTIQLNWFGDSTFIAPLYSLEGFDGVDEILGPYRKPFYLARISFSTGQVDTIARMAGGEGFATERFDAPGLFQRVSQVAVRPGMIVTGDSDLMEFFVYGSTAAVESIIRVPNYDLSISEEDIDRELALWLSPEASPAIQAAAPRMPVPETKAAFRRILLDSEGRIWAQLYQTMSERDGPQMWEVFDTDGRWLGPVETPDRFNVWSIGENYVAGVFKDELDVQHPMILALRH